jgi:hypothetical protein
MSDSKKTSGLNRFLDAATSPFSEKQKFYDNQARWNPYGEMKKYQAPPRDYSTSLPADLMSNDPKQMDAQAKFDANMRASAELRALKERELALQKQAAEMRVRKMFGLGR